MLVRAAGNMGEGGARVEVGGRYGEGAWGEGVGMVTTDRVRKA